MDEFPKEAQWWNPEHRPATAEESTLECKHCNKPLASAMIKICPRCALKLHADCYEDTEGGRAYATEGCDTCRHRTYWR